MKAKDFIKKRLTEVSPTLNTKIAYYFAKNEWPNLKRPNTFEEKLSWLKLNSYSNDPLISRCADKYRVRGFVREQGFADLLNDLIAAWDQVADIDWDNLPERFALKCNHGSGYNIICPDKSKLDIRNTVSTLEQWMQDDFWKLFAELNYKNIPKKIICESYLDTDQGTLPTDYKIYCFNGKPTVILMISNRDIMAKGIFMSTDWKIVANTTKYAVMENLPSRPESLNLMLSAAKALSEPFPFVRVDFYECKGKAVFGEMTFTPGGGIHVSQTRVDGKDMGELLNISSTIESWNL